MGVGVGVGVGVDVGVDGYDEISNHYNYLCLLHALLVILLSISIK